MIPALGFALAAAYVPGIVGAASTPRWLVLTIGAGLGAAFLRTPEIKISGEYRASISGALFVAWALLTMAWSPAPERFDEGWKLLLLVVLFVVGSRLDTLRLLLVGCAFGLAISSVLVILDRLGLIEYAQAVRPSGLFGNGLYLAEFAAMVMVGCLAYRAWGCALLCVPSIVLVNLPRGPLLALFVAAIVWLYKTPRLDKLLFGMFGVGIVVMPLLILARPDSVTARLDIWHGVLSHLAIFGHGLGAFFGDAPLLGTLRDMAAGRPLHANNDLIEIAYDLGPVGVVLALAFVASLLWPRPQRYGFVEYGLSRTDGMVSSMSPGVSLPSAATLIVVVFLIEGLFGFPGHLPATAGLFALAAGHLVRA